jgi:hypothetical protein
MFPAMSGFYSCLSRQQYQMLSSSVVRFTLNNADINSIDLWRNGIQLLMILYQDVIVAGRQVISSMSKLSVPQEKNTIVKNAWVSMIYVIAKSKATSLGHQYSPYSVLLRSNNDSLIP